MRASGYRDPMVGHKVLQSTPLAGQRARGTHLLEHAVQGLGAADVKADEHSVRVRVGQGTDVVVIRRACGEEWEECGEQVPSH